MNCELEKVEKAKGVLQNLVRGTNPLNGEQIDKDSLLCDVRMVRNLFIVSEVLDQLLEGNYSRERKKLPFVISRNKKTV